MCVCVVCLIVRYPFFKVDFLPNALWCRCCCRLSLLLLSLMCRANIFCSHRSGLTVHSTPLSSTSSMCISQCNVQCHCGVSISKASNENTHTQRMKTTSTAYYPISVQIFSYIPNNMPQTIDKCSACFISSNRAIFDSEMWITQTACLCISAHTFFLLLNNTPKYCNIATTTSPPPPFFVESIRTIGEPHWLSGTIVRIAWHSHFAWTIVKREPK